MVFNTEYYSTLDRGFYHKNPTGAEPESVDFPEPREQITELTNREIGTTADANIYPITALQAKIREGVGRVEMTFLGTGKGGFGGQQATPEVLGRIERDEMRELAKLNEIKVSTHASPGFQGLSGFDPRSGRFDDEAIQQNIKEINKAIEFAANATTGGAVVFHTGEWTRPIMEAGLTAKERSDMQKRGLFKEYESEENKAPILLADSETGKVTAISRDTKFYFPEEEIDKISGVRYVKTKKDGAPDVREYDFRGALNHIKGIHKNDAELQGKTDGEILLYGLYEQELRSAQGDMKRFFSDVKEWRDELNRIVKAKELAKKFWDTTPESERWKLLEQVGISSARIAAKYGSTELKNPMEIIEKEEERIRSQLEGHQSIAVAQQEKYEQILRQQQRLKPIEQVGIERSAKSIAQVGMKAMHEYERNKKKLDEPLYVAPEGYEPNYYGSHPDEIRIIINESRKAMAQQLMKEGYSRGEAEQKAKTHIRATLDTGHLNMWRQHFQAKEGETPDHRDARYKKWYLEETEKLAKEGIIGQIHLSDNWGYDDEHLTAGQGNVPVKEFIKNMEKHGVKTFIAERGSFNAQTILPDTLAEIGSPIYALGRRMNFSKFYRGHFGYSAPPNYIVGAYAPSNEWRLWSEVPLE